MKRTAAIAFIVSLLLCACTQNKHTAQIPVVGEAVDSAAIAQDTLGQKSLEESYEYAHTVVVSPTLVYDVRAYGGPPSHGEYCIIRRAADNKPDTVVHGTRFGVIVNTFTADLDSNGEEEVYIVTRRTVKGSPSYVSGFEFSNTGKPRAINFGSISKTNINDTTLLDPNFPADTIFIDHRVLVKMTSAHMKTSPEVFLDDYYTLKNGKVRLTNNFF